jgi:RES domain
VRLYRVLLHDPNAAPHEPGGVLYVPPQQGGGRIDNPQAYRVLYVGDSPAGVCAEVFYRGAHRLKWTGDMLPLRRYAHLVRSLAWYDVAENAAIADLDDPHRLIEFNLRPSNVITRDYSQSQAWALRIFERGEFGGIAWWSFNDARWKSAGLWNLDLIVASGIEALTIDHPAFAEAAAILDIKLER